ncbi:PREDICTED: hyaluronidase-2-like isoform X3 [Poecilia mexicana]|uniref:hyaluronidase-2-like isoform X2 n=1 Tax=Poecilia mexicana TaxID=48701 RepID=UPI00072E97C8|nr:PREDICTED: hyaluronidase-2-like isoform X2 [Poecilia mexicana]XP_014854884.1 PREDICTED: hyaluronidase-2-like isoform X3 [Poecilia mexicana]
MRTVFPSFLSAVDRLSWLLLPLFTSWIVLGSADTKQTSWPLHPKKPVLFVWNAPTQDCETQERVKLSLDQFDIVSSPAQGVVGQVLTLFYKDRLGIYPYYEAEAEDAPVNGGLPQSVILSQHLEKMSKDLDTYIPDRKAKGVSVIDWEEWRPLWVRNWSGKDIYRRKSRELLAKKNSTLTQGQVATAAKEEFELSASNFMLETLKQAKSLRPNQLWGFYQFPDCYNHNFKGKMDSYTGRCPDVEYERNDQLNWLWNESTALFPSIYLDPELRSTDQGRLFVLSRVKEAMRLASVGDGLARPVYVYSRPTYNSEMTLLTEKDLVSTIGESVALGAAGVIFWGGSSYATSSGCSDLNNYFRGPMGRYLLNVTTAAKECSQKLCKFNGRCLRRAPDSAVFLHLSPSTHKIISQSGKLKVTGSPGQAELKAFRQHFKCQCYNGTKGESCELGGKGGKGGKGEKGQREQKSSATSVLGMWPLCFVLQLGLLSLFH